MLTCTLDLYTDYLLRLTGPTMATGLSRRLDGALSHDHVTRWLSQTTYGPAEVWRQAKPLIRQAEVRRPADGFAVLLVDDSVLEKAHTDANELISTHWDHRQQRYVKGLNFVSLRYQAGELALSHHFVFALESSRIVALSDAARAQGQFQSMQSLVFPNTQPLRVYLRSVQEAVLVSRRVLPNQDDSPGMLYWVSSDPNLDQAQLTTIYPRRWKGEEYHKSLQQNASVAKSPTKTLATQATHFFAAVLAYTKLEVLKLKCGIGYFRLKAQRYTVGLKALSHQLGRLRA